MLPHESAIVYVLRIVLGHVPLSVCDRLNELATTPQLSVTVPPAFVNAVSVVYAGGMLVAHSPEAFGGHVITGGCGSSTIIV